MFGTAFFPVILGTIALCACAVAPPTGPAVVALPPVGKNLAQFQREDTTCRGYAQQQIRFSRWWGQRFGIGRGTATALRCRLRAMHGCQRQLLADIPGGGVLWTVQDTPMAIRAISVLGMAPRCHWASSAVSHRTSTTTSVRSMAMAAFIGGSRERRNRRGSGRVGGGGDRQPHWKAPERADAYACRAGCR